MTDEGTLFSLVSQLSVSTDAHFKQYFKESFFRNATQYQVDQLCDMYPQDPSADHHSTLGSQTPLAHSTNASPLWLGTAHSRHQDEIC
jgi:hypothetical protein